LEDQIAIGACREKLREIPARPAPAASMRAMVGGLSELSAPAVALEPKASHAPASPVFRRANRRSRRS
jgi:hypothetical protein